MSKGWQLKEYHCPWCDHEFEKEVKYLSTSKKGVISSQVRCPHCVNLIPTWKKELTGNIIRRKHIHIGR